MSHSIHAILVKIPYAAEAAEKNLSEMKKEEIKEMVIGYATEETECFSGWAFDYRALLDDEPVLFANDNWDMFEEVLLAIDSDQKNYAKETLEDLEEEVETTDLSVILNNLLLVNDRTASCDSVDSKTWRFDHLNHDALALVEIARLIHGDYYFESEFYDTSRRTALVPFIAKLKENPADWALVQFDYHW